MKEANHLLVHERLSHHLLLSSIIKKHMENPKIFPELCIFAGLIFAWNMLCSRPRFSDADLRLRVYVYAAMLIFAAGWAINLFIAAAPELTASLLRFYFFRLTDVMLPLGCAMLAVQVCCLPAVIPEEKKNTAEVKKHRQNHRQRRRVRVDRPVARKIFLTLLIGVSVVHVYYCAARVITPAAPRNCPAAAKSWPWKDLCEAAKLHTEPGETFIVPYTYRTFTWYSGRNVVVTWKDMPQDAKNLGEWWTRIQSLYYGHMEDKDGILRYGRLKKFSDTPRERFPQMAKRYGVKYLVAMNDDMKGLSFPVVYRNEEFSVWRIDGETEAAWE